MTARGSFGSRYAESAGSASGLAERAPRTLTLLMTGKLVTGSGEGLCRVRNISSTGMQIETRRHLTAGDLIRVELRGLCELPGRVAWCQPPLAGIALSSPIAVEELLHPRPASRLTRSRSPRAPRIGVECVVELETGGGPCHGQLRDLSQGGARLCLPASPRREERITVAIPGLPLKSGIVRWVRGADVGIAFYEPLPFDLLADWIAERDDEEDGAAVAG